MKRYLLAATAALTLAGCHKDQPAPVYEMVPVQRRDIVVTASAAGTIQPILTVQVKSQASGAITEMRVQTGDDVRPGQLLALIDPRLPKSALDQAKATLDVARASYDNAAGQFARDGQAGTTSRVAMVLPPMAVSTMSFTSPTVRP